MDSNRMISGLVLRRQPYRENDLLISLFSRQEGYIELIARGARKAGSKLAGHIEPLTISEIMVIAGKNKDYAASAINSISFLNIKTNFEKLEYAGKAISFFFSFLKPEERDPAFFDFLNFSLDSLDRLEDEDLNLWGDWWLLVFKYKALCLLGYQPNFSNFCSVCKKDNPANSAIFYFNISNSSFICAACKPKAEENEELVLTISSNCVNILHYLSGEYRKDKEFKLMRGAVKEANRLLDKLKSYII